MGHHWGVRWKSGGLPLWSCQFFFYHQHLASFLYRPATPSGDPQLTTDTVIKMTLDKFPEQGVPYKAWRRAPGLNYLVYDSHRDAPVGFAIRVGKKDDDPIMELSAARRAVEAAKSSRA